MTSSKCTICDGVLTERGPKPTLVCEDCGRVNDGQTTAENADGINQPTGATPDEGNHTSDWTKSVDVADSTDQKIVDLLSRVDQVGSNLQAGPSDRNRTAELVTDAWEHRLLEGRSVDSAVGACWYVTFRDQGKPRPIGVVADAVGSTSSELHAFRQTVSDELDVSLTVVQPSEYLPYLRSQLDLSTMTVQTAKELLEGVSLGGNPAGIAAGGLYIAAHELSESVTMVEAARAVDLSKETIWQRVDDLRNQIQ